MTRQLAVLRSSCVSYRFSPHPLDTDGSACDRPGRQREEMRVGHKCTDQRTKLLCCENPSSATRTNGAEAMDKARSRHLENRNEHPGGQGPIVYTAGVRVHKEAPWDEWLFGPFEKKHG